MTTFDMATTEGLRDACREAERVHPYVPAMQGGRRNRPVWKTQRAFAALFPNDIIPYYHYSLYQLVAHGMGKSGMSRRHVRASRWILDRMAAAIGPVDSIDCSAVARRARLPRVLHTIYEENKKPREGSADSADLPVVRPEPSTADPVAEPTRPALGKIMAYFDSILKREKLVFDWNMVESLHLGLWANERRHFAVLTGLSGTGKTQLAIQYAIAVTSAGSESSAQIWLSSNGCGWVEARSAGRRGVLAARVASELTAHGVHLTGGGRGAPWPGVGRSGVAAGRPACQRATRVLRCATALRVTHRPSLRSSSRYGPCGPAWTGASRPSTTTRKARRLAVRG